VAQCSPSGPGGSAPSLKASIYRAVCMTGQCWRDQKDFAVHKQCSFASIVNRVG
jgi:hypothetical protein